MKQKVTEIHFKLISRRVSTKILIEFVGWEWVKNQNSSYFQLLFLAEQTDTSYVIYDFFLRYLFYKNRKK